MTLAILVVVSASKIKPSAAQGNIQALTYYAVTVYSDPDRAAPIVGILIPHAKVVLEARNIDARWVLGHSTDGTVRGWMDGSFLALPSDATLPGLQVSEETIFISAAAHSAAAYTDIRIEDYPIVPNRMGGARAIFEVGQSHGAEPHVVSKVGDCISDNVNFLSPFGLGTYNLGKFTYLQPVVDTFSASLAYNSLAAYDGLVTPAVLDPLFANPLVCLPGETPLRCEYRVHKSSVAIIMFGAQDLLFTPAEDFDSNLRQIVHETIQAGVIPILSTFPGNLARWDQTIQYNQIVIQIALDYDIPLMNLWLALESLPHHGLNTDGRHLSLPITTAGDLTPDNLQRGYPIRNLITLQALDAVWRGAMY